MRRTILKLVLHFVDKLLNPWLILAVFGTIKVYSIREQITADGYFLATVIFFAMCLRKLEESSKK